MAGIAFWVTWTNPENECFVIKEGVEESWECVDKSHAEDLANRFNEHDNEKNRLKKALEKAKGYLCARPLVPDPIWEACEVIDDALK